MYVLIFSSEIFHSFLKIGYNKMLYIILQKNCKHFSPTPIKLKWFPVVYHKYNCLVWTEPTITSCWTMGTLYPTC